MFYYNGFEVLLFQVCMWRAGAIGGEKILSRFLLTCRGRATYWAHSPPMCGVCVNEVKYMFQSPLLVENNSEKILVLDVAFLVKFIKSLSG